MSDFHQGAITTIHDLKIMSHADRVQQLEGFAQKTSMTLILPALYSEFETDSMPSIIASLKNDTYIDRIILGLDRATDEQFEEVKEKMSVLPQKMTILHNDGKRMKTLDNQLKEDGLAPPEPGKGRNVWYCLGAALAYDSDIIALHDCDIVTDTSEIRAKLFHPMANPLLSYEFAKGYYPRISDGKMNGRATRLLVTPLLNALYDMADTAEERKYIRYMQSFRYALSGEFAMSAKAARGVRIPYDWGLEVGSLSEMYENLRQADIAQVELADNYDHKHQALSAEDKEKGLNKMAIDIVKTVMRKMAAMYGTEFSESKIRSLQARYYRCAVSVLEAYKADALSNGLKINQHIEEEAINVFKQAIAEAGVAFGKDGHEKTLLDNWERVQSARPTIFEDLQRAIEFDATDQLTSEELEMLEKAGLSQKLNGGGHSPALTDGRVTAAPVFAPSI